MKETVTKSAKKPGSATVAATSRKTGVIKAVAAVLSKKIAKSKPAVTPVAKSSGRPAVKKVVAAKAAPGKAMAPEPALEATTATLNKATLNQAAPAKAAATKAALKSLAAVAARPAAKTQQAPKAHKAGTKKTVDQQAVKAGETGARTDAVASVTAELADKMKTSVVSKVSEVMTKTTKSTPAQDGRLISEDDIRVMGEKDYMNPAQLAFFKARLQQLEKDLLKNAGETTEHLRETVLVPDPADRATIEEEHALELRTRDRERKLLKKVQQSIAAIDGGDYGWCEETGEPIGIPRLIARPTATLSLEAQQRRELKQKLYGD